MILSKFREVNLKLSPSKCEFGSQEIAFSGHIINADGIRRDVSMVEAIKLLKEPQNKKEVQRQLGLFNYLSRYMDFPFLQLHYNH